MNDEFVSIIMPAYNAENSIACSIRSVLRQTHQHLELIIVDDGSQDATTEIVESFDDSRVVLIGGAHEGVSAARNKGLSRARGAFIKYIDSDDLISDSALAAQVARLRAEQGLALCTSAWGRFARDLSDLRVVRARDWQDLDVISFLELSLGGGGTMPVMTWMIPRALSDRVGDWRCGAQLYEDTEYLALLVLNSARVVFTEDAWGYYRTREGTNLSSTVDPEVLRHGLSCVRNISDRVLSFQDSPRVRHMLANFWRRYTMRVIGIDESLVRESERQVAAYGGSSLVPKGGLRYRLLQHVLGWRMAARVRRWVNARKALRERFQSAGGT